MLLPTWAARSARYSRLLAPVALVPLLLTTAATSPDGAAPAAPAAVGASAAQHDAVLAGAAAQAVDAQSATASHGRVTFLTAVLSGRNEISPTGANNAGDPEGRAVEVVRIQGTQACFATRWAGIAAPVAHHIHAGAAGENGPVNVLFFGAALPATLSSVAGCVTADAALLQQIAANPRNFYVNIHTAEFPAGAVRAQLRRGLPTSLVAFVARSFGGRLFANMSGANENPAADPDGQAIGLATGRGTNVQFFEAWRNLDTVVASHIHRGVAGMNGPIVVPFFGGALPTSLFAIAGTVQNVDAALVQEINGNPAGFYMNIHTNVFPPGAVRAQLQRIF